MVYIQAIERNLTLLPPSPPFPVEQVQKSQYYFFQAVEFLLPGKFLFIFSAKSTK